MKRMGFIYISDINFSDFHNYEYLLCIFKFLVFSVEKTKFYIYFWK